MGKHRKARTPRGFGRKGSGKHHGLAARLKIWDEIINHKTPTRATLMTGNTAMLHRPGCKSAGYHKPGSNKR